MLLKPFKSKGSHILSTLVVLARRLQPNCRLKERIREINPLLDTELVTKRAVSSAIQQPRPEGLIPSLSNLQHDIRARC